MSKTDQYLKELRSMADPDPFLLQHSGLPGPRGNLELAQAAAAYGTPADYRRWLAYTPDIAPTNTPGEFLAFCGILGLGVLLARGGAEHLPVLRGYANDPRWRAREAVAMALQRLGDADMPRLLAEMRLWAEGAALEQRAAAAALCEPRLLQEPAHAAAVLEILDTITAAYARSPQPRSPASRILRQGLGYCWSVAAAALPEAGKPLLEHWLASADSDIRWIMRENLRKTRLQRADAAWVQTWLAKL